MLDFKNFSLNLIKETSWFKAPINFIQVLGGVLYFLLIKLVYI